MKKSINTKINARLSQGGFCYKGKVLNIEYWEVIPKLKSIQCIGGKILQTLTKIIKANPENLRL